VADGAEQQLSSPVTAFISYAERDGSEFAKRLEAALEAKDFEVWVDYEGIALGTRWREEIQESLVRSDVVLFVITPGSAASKECRRELDYAAELGKRIIPINFIEVPTGELPELIPTLNWVPRKGTFGDAFDENLERLVEQCRLDPVWLKKHTEIQEQAVAWEAAGRARGHLLRGSRLSEAEAWQAGRAGKEPQPTALHDELIFTSRKAANRRQRGGVTVGLAILVVIAGLAVIAVLERQNAVEQRQVAEAQRDEAEARALASTALLNLDDNPEASIDYAARSLEIRETPTAADALRLALDRSDIRTSKEIEPHDPALAEAYAEEAFLAEHESGSTVAIAYSPDGARIAAMGSTGDLEVFEVESGEMLMDADQDLSQIGYSDVDFDPEGERVVVPRDQGAVQVLDAETGDELLALEHGETVSDVGFSPDGSRIVTAANLERVYGDDGTLAEDYVSASVRIWDAESGEVIAEFDEYLDFDFVDEDRLLIGNSQGLLVVGLSDGSEQGEVAVESSGDEVMTSFAVAGRNRELLAGAFGDEVRVFDLATGKLQRTLRGHSGRVGAFAASEDGGLLASGGQDGARVWDLGDGSELAFLRGGDEYTVDVEFDPADASRLATAVGTRVSTWEVQEASNLIERLSFSAEDAWTTADGAIVAYDGSESVEIVGEEGAEELRKFLGSLDAFNVLDADVDADGAPLVVATVNGGRDMVLYHASGDEPVELISESDTQAYAPVLIDAERSRVILAIGAKLEIVGVDGERREIEAECGTPQEGVPASIAPVDVSPDGDTVLVTGSNAACAIPIGGGKGVAFESPGGGISDAVFLDGGASVVTGGLDRAARLWDAKSGEEVRSFLHDDSVLDVEPGVDDSYFLTVTGSTGEGFSDHSFGDVTAWGVSTGRELFSFPGQKFVVQRPDGAIATGDESEVLVYGCDVCRPVDALRELAGERVTTEAGDNATG
jgi:WD40 repeat protein